jgi:hypothetical protein
VRRGRIGCRAVLVRRHHVRRARVVRRFWRGGLAVCVVRVPRHASRGQLRVVETVRHRHAVA